MILKEYELVSLFLIKTSYSKLFSVAFSINKLSSEELKYPLEITKIKLTIIITSPNIMIDNKFV
jgi:thiamine pyrophosphokinase